MRVLVNFMLREVWHIHCMDADAQTPISPFITARNKSILILLLRYVGATDDEIVRVQHDINQWGRGSVWIDLVPGCRNLLRIWLPWSDDLLR